MNQLTVDEKTGFLQSANSLLAFNAEKKSNFIALALKFIKENDEIPRFSSICDAVGVSMHTFEYHTRNDSAFNNALKEVLLRGQDILSHDFFVNGRKSSGTLGALAWLRKHFDGWNQESKLTVTHEKKFNPIQAESVEYVDIEPLQENTSQQTSPQITNHNPSYQNLNDDKT